MICFLSGRKSVIHLRVVFDMLSWDSLLWRRTEAIVLIEEQRSTNRVRVPEESRGWSKKWSPMLTASSTVLLAL